MEGTIRDLHDIPGDGWPWPTLLRFSAQVIHQRARQAVVAAGFADLRPGDYLFLELCVRGVDTIAALAESLEVTRQAVSKTVDSLVERDYLVRSPHAGDRRRVDLSPAAKGEAVSAVYQRVRAEEEARLEIELGPAAADLRAGLARFIEATPGARAQFADARRAREAFGPPADDGGSA